MKPRLLRTTGPWPPGGFQYSDGTTGKQYNEGHYTFEDLVRAVIRDRLANKRLWTDVRLVDTEYVATQVSEQNCARLNGDNRFCSGNGAGVAAPSYVGSPMEAKCICGSKDLESKTCVSCGNKRVGYRCRKCGNEFNV